MSTISNRFYITALDDGTTLHGSLLVDGSLVQSWNKSSQTAVPDWSIAANQPTIYLTLFSGSSLVAPAAGFQWYYNDQLISSSDTRFQTTTKSVTIGGSTAQMPALKVVANLASDNNVDIDLITFKGTYAINGSSVAFSSTIQVRISSITAGSNLGIINFVNGVKDITEPNQAITMYGKVFDSNGGERSGVTTKWYLNDASTGVSGTSITVGSTTYANAYQITEDDVVDHATVRVDFIGTDNAVICSTYAFIDDLQDPEFLYIQYGASSSSVQNGNAASLREGDTAYFKMWVGTRDDANVLGGTSTPTYDTIKIKFLNAAGTPITSGNMGTGMSDTPDSDGYYSVTMSAGVGSPAIPYSVVKSAGNNLTGIVYASSSN